MVGSRQVWRKVFKGTQCGQRYRKVPKGSHCRLSFVWSSIRKPPGQSALESPARIIRLMTYRQLDNSAKNSSFSEWCDTWTYSRGDIFIGDWRMLGHVLMSITIYSEWTNKFCEKIGIHWSCYGILKYFNVPWSMLVLKSWSLKVFAWKNLIVAQWAALSFSSRCNFFEHRLNHGNNFPNETAAIVKMNYLSQERDRKPSHRTHSKSIV